MRVVAAMSGGVDSSVAAALLLEQGHEVIGVHMKLHDEPPPSLKGGPVKRCCGLDDAWDARRVADKLGIPFYVMDLRREFRAAVMDYFADTYLKGATPNPCVQCNGVLKFRVLLQRARALGASHLATGHYARVQGGRLLMAADPAKDQSYFLFPMPAAALEAALFPLGGMTKPEVRERARQLGLATAEKPESQEICFVPDDDHARFVREHRAELSRERAVGDIVDESGAVLGVHDGYWRYTVGQRRGLGVAAGEPRYVLRVDPQTRQVVIGAGDRLWGQSLTAGGVNWLRRPDPGEELRARIRHRGELYPAEILADSPLRLRLGAPARAITPGQAVVLYSGEEVVAGGWIEGEAA